MDLSAFKESLKNDQPPAGIGNLLTALWHEGKKDWEKAHDTIQDGEDRESAWIHAYLHRKEGDPGNAGYWYRRAGQKMPSCPLEQEWEELVRHFLVP
ncbi:MAG: hypothetical protein P4L51_29230 [Puia sp.]|nr:hypothetical protein [Puia sp.]